ncbi:MAG TPA: hypothetical protein VHE83_16625 [Mycobacteriales bacterium]|nr:hypothetical protein [Mycobacteriales bacterium]
MGGSRRTATTVTALALVGASTVLPAGAVMPRAAVSLSIPACVVGRFTDARAVSTGTFTFNGQYLHLVGAKGEVFVQRASGSSYDDYQHAGPLSGTYAGSRITLTFRGRITHQVIGATARALRVRDVTRSMRGVFTWQGQRYPFRFALLSHQPYTVRVACTARGFTDTGAGGSDTYVRAGAAPKLQRARASAAPGGSSIATAPRLAWGVTEEGVGGDNFESQDANAPDRGQTFWRAQVFKGDLVTGRFTASSTNGCGTNRIELFAPTVTDATLGSSTPTFNTGTEGDTTNTCGAHRTEHWRWSHVPYSGLATIWAGISGEAPTFSFVATVAHRTTVHLASLPRSVPAGSSITVHATVRSVAGVPAGSCTFAERVGTGRWVTVARARTRKGSCLARITIPPAASSTLRVRVRFASNGPWQSATVVSTILRAT